MQDYKSSSRFRECLYGAVKKTVSVTTSRCVSKVFLLMMMLTETLFGAVQVLSLDEVNSDGIYEPYKGGGLWFSRTRYKNERPVQK